MGFREHLVSVVDSVGGAVACSLMGFDGIAVETHQAESKLDVADAVEFSNAFVEYGSTLMQLKNAAEALKTGAVAEVSVCSEKLLTVMRLVNAEYFVALAMTPDGNYGKGRYALRLAAPQLAREL